MGGLLDRLVYLGFGLALVLGFIGVKLIIHAMEANTLGFINGGQPIEGLPHISTSFSLAVIVGILVVTTVASLIRSGMVANRASDRQGDGRVEPARPPRLEQGNGVRWTIRNTARRPSRRTARPQSQPVRNTDLDARSAALARRLAEQRQRMPQ